MGTIQPVESWLNGDVPTGQSRRRYISNYHAQVTLRTCSPADFLRGLRNVSPIATRALLQVEAKMPTWSLGEAEGGSRSLEWKHRPKNGPGLLSLATLLEGAAF